MLGYIIKRIFMTVPVMVVVALFVFLLLRLSPGDPAAVIAGDYATAEDVQKIREKLGLNKPIYKKTAAYGHFGRKPDQDGGFGWEKLDLVDALSNEFK